MSFLDNVLSGLAYRLKTLSGVVDVSEAPAPAPGQVLTALDATHAEWADPTGGGGGGGGYVIADALSTGSGDPAEAVDVSGSPIPTAGQVLIAQGADAAAWRDPVWLPLDEFGTSNTVICAIDGDGGLGPVPVYMPPSTVLMRAADGDLFAGEPTDLATLLSGQSLNDSAAVPKALFDANTVLTADVDNTPHAITMPPSTVLTRLASGAIKAGTVAELRTLLGIGSSITGRTPLWAPPATPNANDKEFDIDADATTGLQCWDATNSLAMTPTFAPIDRSQNPPAVTYPLIQVPSSGRRSFLKINPSNAGYVVMVTWPVVVPTNCFIWASIGVLQATGGLPQHTFELVLGGSTSGHADRSKAFLAGVISSANYRTENNGVTSGNTPVTQAWEYIGIWKIGTAYRAYLFNDNGHYMTDFGVATNATAMDRWGILISGSAATLNSPLFAVDFLRMAASPLGIIDGV
jgi:hypothetical protein